jgi:hypothetical protein
VHQKSLQSLSLVGRRKCSSSMTSSSWQIWRSILSTIAVVIGAVGGLCGLWSVWYSRRQTVLMEVQIHKQDAQDAEELRWSERFERLTNQLVRINPQLQIQEPGKDFAVPLYITIFHDPKFRESLETYIVQVDSTRTQFSRRSPRPDELRRSNLRDTIKIAEQCMAEFQKSNPRIDLKYYMG